MSEKNRCKPTSCPTPRGQAHQPTSFWMHDPDQVFRCLRLSDGDRFLDLGCGLGDYSMYASPIVGNGGVVYALDRSEELMNGLNKEANAQGLRNIKTLVADITGPLPIEDFSIDVCLLATVLHIPDVNRGRNTLFNEIRRVLKPSGQLAILECKKEVIPFGPPLDMRLSQEELETFVPEHAFVKIDSVDLGYNYLIQFALKGGS